MNRSKTVFNLLFLCSMNISAVIITRNESHIIGTTLQALQGIADEIVIVDSGSTDATLDVCRHYNALILETGWEGYGPNKNKGIRAAKHDWILNLDADEVIDEELRRSISSLNLQDPHDVFEMRYQNYFLNKRIRFGEWGHDKHIRMFNRTHVQWNEAAVHEMLEMDPGAKIILLKGHILHHTVHSLAEYEQKTVAYAKLNAQKYFEQGKKWQWFRQYLSPGVSFLHNYLFRLGFLDGREGLLIARTTARYTFLKYAFLGEMYSQKNQQQF
jgi:glycosyltransferase involved in cell wall biosynthesis